MPSLKLHKIAFHSDAISVKDKRMSLLKKLQKRHLANFFSKYVKLEFKHR